jgi:hypothetical protein
MGSKMSIKSRISGYLDRFRNNSNNSKKSNSLASLVNKLHHLRIGTTSTNSLHMGSNASNDHTTPEKQQKPTKSGNLIDKGNFNNDNTNCSHYIETCSITTNTIYSNSNDLHINNNNSNAPNFIDISSNNTNNNNNNNKSDQSSNFTNFNKMAQFTEEISHNTQQHHQLHEQLQQEQQMKFRNQLQQSLQPHPVIHQLVQPYTPETTKFELYNINFTFFGKTHGDTPTTARHLHHFLNKMTIFLSMGRDIAGCNETIALQEVLRKCFKDEAASHITDSLFNISINSFAELQEFLLKIYDDKKRIKMLWKEFRDLQITDNDQWTTIIEECRMKLDNYNSAVNLYSLTKEHNEDESTIYSTTILTYKAHTSDTLFIPTIPTDATRTPTDIARAPTDTARAPPETARAPTNPTIAPIDIPIILSGITTANIPSLAPISIDTCKQ